MLDEPTASLDGETGPLDRELLRTNVLNDHALDRRRDARSAHPRSGRQDRIDGGRASRGDQGGQLANIEERTQRVKHAPLYALSAAGILAGVSSAILFAQERPPLPPVFTPAANPYAKGIYANGMVESYQSHGENINIYPEVAGPITKILVARATRCSKAHALLAIDDFGAALNGPAGAVAGRGGACRARRAEGRASAGNAGGVGRPGRERQGRPSRTRRISSTRRSSPIGSIRSRSQERPRQCAQRRKSRRDQSRRGAETVRPD